MSEIKVAARDVEVMTIDYVWSHGKEPRGRGGWIFSTCRNGRGEMFFANGTYGEAKREAVQKAAAAGYYRIYTCS